MNDEANMSRRESSKGRRKPVYLYEVRERLIGEAIYEVEATSKAEAFAKVRASDAGDMIESGIDHTGRGIAKRLERVDG